MPPFPQLNGVRAALSAPFDALLISTASFTLVAGMPRSSRIPAESPGPFDAGIPSVPGPPNPDGGWSRASASLPSLQVLPV